ncbi:MAG: tyrosine--tRNA ligase [Candidatus Levyibacteriota bacterium]
MNDIDELLVRSVANIIPGKSELSELLKSGKKSNVYLGIDPTATKIHLGHAVPLRKLQKFAEMGHNVTFLIGDFTALIGDTSDKDSERPILTPKQIEENFQTYKKQAEKILDFSKVKVRHNSEWLKKLTFEEIIKLSHAFSLNDFISRELIRKRLDEKKNIGLAETQYPMMQGYDSYFLDTDLQIGGTDQTFNMQAGRTLQKKWRNKESFVLATEFLMGTDGRKMSKTWNNAIWLDDSPNDMYAKIMRVEDNLIIDYFTLATNISLEEIEKIKEELKKENPINVKKKLAKIIVTELYDEKTAKDAEKEFESRVQNKKLPTQIRVQDVAFGAETIDYLDMLVQFGLASSRGEAKRLILGGGVEINGKKITEPSGKVTVEDDTIIKVGKRSFVKIKIK